MEKTFTVQELIEDINHSNFIGKIPHPNGPLRQLSLHNMAANDVLLDKTLIVKKDGTEVVVTRGQIIFTSDTNAHVVHGGEILNNDFDSKDIPIHEISSISLIHNTPGIRIQYDFNYKGWIYKLG